MGDTEDEKTPAGRYLKRRMGQVGFQRKRDLADAAGVSPSTITRLFSVATYRPDVENVRKLATALQVSPDELMAGMAGEAGEPSETPPLHPLAAELGRMLADESPLPEGSRAVLDTLVDRVLEPSRREMRGGQPVQSLRVGDAVISKLPGGKVRVETSAPGYGEPGGHEPDATESRIIPYDPDDPDRRGLHLPPGYPTWKIPHPLAGLILLLDDPRLTPPKRRRVLLMLEEMRLMIGAMLNVEDKTPDEVVDETFAAISEAQRREPAMREKPAGTPGRKQAGHR